MLIESIGTKLVPDAQKVVFWDTISGPLIDRLAIFQAERRPKLLDGTKKMDSFGFRDHG